MRKETEIELTPEIWELVTVEEAVKPFNYARKKQISKSNYKKSGQWPIVDQGQKFIAGYIDDDDKVIHSNQPIIIFGDHTRTLKYIDFEFCLGADGTKPLLANEGFNTKYLYYALTNLEVPARGYNRHYTIFKEMLIVKPTPDEQIKIVNVLDIIRQAIQIQDDIIIVTENLKQSAMHKLFTSGLNEGTQKKTEIGLMPKSWERITIADIGNIITGTTPSTKNKENYLGGDIQFITPGDITHGTTIHSTEKKISKIGLSKSRSIGKNATCFVCIGSTIGKVGYTTEEICITNQQINSIIPNGNFDPLYVFYLMTYWADYVRQQSTPNTVPIISKGVFEKIEITSTLNKNEQMKIAGILNTINCKIDLHRRKRDVLDKLFKSLLHKLMTGEILISNLDLSVFESKSPEVAV